MKLIGVMAAIAAWSLGAGARGDVVETSDGRRFEGQITAEHTYDVVMDTVVNKIRLSLTLQRSEIRTLTRSPVPAGFFESISVKESPRKASADEKRTAPIPKPRESVSGPVPGERSQEKKRAERPRGEPAAPGAYLEVPLEGMFGRDIYPKGVRDALDLAVERGIKHVVFRIRSPGGEVWAARRIMEVLREYEGKVTTHAFVEEAISASIWVVFSCDEVEIAPAGVVGAAVVFKGDSSTGSASVDEKMNSALAGELGSVAERHGRDPAIVRAMIIPEAQLYAWEERGKVRVAGERPTPAPPGLRTLSSTNDVLTLTAKEAARIGLAVELDHDDPAEIGGKEGIDGWACVENAGAQAMQRACKQSAQLRSDVERTVERVRRAVVDATESDPTRYTYEASRSGLMSPDSRRRWSELSDKALAAWSDAKRALYEFKKETARAEELDMGGLVSKIDAQEVKTTIAEIDSRMAELREGRSRERLPADFERK